MTDQKRNPYLKFYARDWRGDAALRMCSFAARGLWIDLLSIMHDEGTPYGHLAVNGVALTSNQLSRMVGSTSKEISNLVSELEKASVFSRTQSGVIYCRRLVRDMQKQELDRANGKSGGNPSLNPRDNGGVNPRDKAHSQKPQPKPLPEPLAAAFEPSELSDQLHRLSRLLGFDESDFRSHSANIRTLTELRQQGCDFQAHILPAAEHAAKAGKAKTLSYIRPRAVELRDASRITASLPTPFEQTNAEGWRGRLRTWNGANGKAGWHPKWGPDPNSPDCKCPPAILAEQIQIPRRVANG